MATRGAGSMKIVSQRSGSGSSNCRTPRQAKQLRDEVVLFRFGDASRDSCRNNATHCNRVSGIGSNRAKWSANTSKPLGNASRDRSNGSRSTAPSAAGRTSVPSAHHSRACSSNVQSTSNRQGGPPSQVIGVKAKLP